MDNNNNNSSKITNRLRRFAIGTVAAVAGLGLAGAGTAAAATPAPDADVVEAEVAVANDWVVEPGSPVIWNGFPVGTVTGGYILGNGTGLIEVSNGEQIRVTSFMVTPGWGGFMAADYAGFSYFGELAPLFPGGHIYEVELENMFGMELELPFLTLSQAS